MRTYGLRFDANCSILFTELPLTRRADAAKAAGFGGVEFWWPWDAMAPSDAEAGTILEVGIRDQRVAAEVVALPFYKRSR